MFRKKNKYMWWGLLILVVIIGIGLLIWFLTKSNSNPAPPAPHTAASTGDYEKLFSNNPPPAPLSVNYSQWLNSLTVITDPSSSIVSNRIKKPENTEDCLRNYFAFLWPSVERSWLDKCSSGMLYALYNQLDWIYTPLIIEPQLPWPINNIDTIQKAEIIGDRQRSLLGPFFNAYVQWFAMDQLGVIAKLKGTMPSSTGNQFDTDLATLAASSGQWQSHSGAVDQTFWPGEVNGGGGILELGLKNKPWMTQFNQTGDSNIAPGWNLTRPPACLLWLSVYGNARLGFPSFAYIESVTFTTESGGELQRGAPSCDSATAQNWSSWKFNDETTKAKRQAWALGVTRPDEGISGAAYMGTSSKWNKQPTWGAKTDLVENFNDCNICMTTQTSPSSGSQCWCSSSGCAGEIIGQLGLCTTSEAGFTTPNRSLYTDPKSLQCALSGTKWEDCSSTKELYWLQMPKDSNSSPKPFDFLSNGNQCDSIGPGCIRGGGGIYIKQNGTFSPYLIPTQDSINERQQDTNNNIGFCGGLWNTQQDHGIGGPNGKNSGFGNTCQSSDKAGGCSKGPYELCYPCLKGYGKFVNTGRIGVFWNYVGAFLTAQSKEGIGKTFRWPFEAAAAISGSPTGSDKCASGVCLGDQVQYLAGSSGTSGYKDDREYLGGFLTVPNPYAFPEKYRNANVFNYFKALINGGAGALEFYLNEEITRKEVNFEWQMSDAARNINDIDKSCKQWNTTSKVQNVGGQWFFTPGKPHVYYDPQYSTEQWKNHGRGNYSKHIGLGENPNVGCGQMKWQKGANVKMPDGTIQFMQSDNMWMNPMDDNGGRLSQLGKYFVQFYAPPELAIPNPNKGEIIQWPQFDSDIIKSITGSENGTGATGLPVSDTIQELCISWTIGFYAYGDTGIHETGNTVQSSPWGLKQSNSGELGGCGYIFGALFGWKALQVNTKDSFCGQATVCEYPHCDPEIKWMMNPSDTGPYSPINRWKQDVSSSNGHQIFCKQSVNLDITQCLNLYMSCAFVPAFLDFTNPDGGQNDKVPKDKNDTDSNSKMVKYFRCNQVNRIRNPLNELTSDIASQKARQYYQPPINVDYCQQCPYKCQAGNNSLCGSQETSPECYPSINYFQESKGKPIGDGWKDITKPGLVTLNGYRNEPTCGSWRNLGDSWWARWEAAHTTDEVTDMGCYSVDSPYLNVKKGPVRNYPSCPK